MCCPLCLPHLPSPATAAQPPPSLARLQTTNLLLQAGDEALRTPPGDIGALAPLRAIQELHLGTAAQLEVDVGAVEEVEALLTQLQQLLVGISIMQVGAASIPVWGGVWLRLKQGCCGLPCRSSGHALRLHEAAHPASARAAAAAAGLARRT